jgi:hypothetical protein
VEDRQQTAQEISPPPEGHDAIHLTESICSDRVCGRAADGLLAVSSSPRGGTIGQEPDIGDGRRY